MYGDPASVHSMCDVKAVPAVMLVSLLTPGAKLANNTTSRGTSNRATTGPTWTLRRPHMAIVCLSENPFGLRRWLDLVADVERTNDLDRDPEGYSEISLDL